MAPVGVVNRRGDQTNCRECILMNLNSIAAMVGGGRFAAAVLLYYRMNFEFEIRTNEKYRASDGSDTPSSEPDVKGPLYINK